MEGGGFRTSWVEVTFAVRAAFAEATVGNAKEQESASIITCFIGKPLKHVMLTQVVPWLSARGLPCLHSNSDIGCQGRRRNAWPCMEKTEAALHAAQQFAARFIYQVAPSRNGNSRRGVGAVLQQFSSTVRRDSIRSDKLHKLRRQPLPLQPLPHLPPPRDARPLHGKRHRDRYHRDRLHHGRRQHGQLQRLFDMRRRRLRQSRYTRC
jgi:hypothetical protein